MGIQSRRGKKKDVMGVARSKTDRELIVKNPDERQAVPIRGWLTVKAVINSLFLLPGFQNHAVTGTVIKDIASKLNDVVFERGHVDMLLGHVNGTADLTRKCNRIRPFTWVRIQAKLTQFAFSACVSFRIGAFHGAEGRDDPDLAVGKGR
jgi:hypothetical protein